MGRGKKMGRWRLVGDEGGTGLMVWADGGRGGGDDVAG